jgi:hypothetical protein
MPAELEKDELEFTMSRLLMPSSLLYGLVFVANSSIVSLIALFLLAAETAVIAFSITLLLGLGFIWMSTEAISEWLAKRAEQAGRQPGVLYEADVKREKRRYGPLRANRLFGHPIGKCEK